ncbi:protein argonaute 18-like [Setaria viridis]|uniref:protein argonaute 18-like n=1 Tax=Setaria viridis TaxID=4556 RepID=UPI00149346F7|nr:protein argonaute 18-like [Setaria viridis]
MSCLPRTQAAGAPRATVALLRLEGYPVTVHAQPAPCRTVVASQDWREVVKYNSVVRAQGHREEIVSGLEEIVTELLDAFGKVSNMKPQQLIFYRVGISEGQFKQILEKEIPEIEKAWKSLYNNEKPQITYNALQKSHQRRLFPNSNKCKALLGDRGNVEHGTVIDREMCQPTEFDFFLCSHPATKGPSRPVQYLVLRDENNFTADELQSLTNNLCYTYASSTQSVLIGSNAAAAASSGGATAPAGGAKQLPEIKDELKRSMFYC